MVGGNLSSAVHLPVAVLCTLPGLTSQSLIDIGELFYLRRAFCSQVGCLGTERGRERGRERERERERERGRERGR